MNRSLLPPALNNPLAALQPAARPAASAGADETRSPEFSRALFEARQAARLPSLEPTRLVVAPSATSEPPPRAPERAPDRDPAQRPTPRTPERAEGRGNGRDPEAPDVTPPPRAAEDTARRARPPESTAARAPRGAAGAPGPDDPAGAKGIKGGKGANGTNGANGPSGAARNGHSSTRPGARKASVPDVDSAGAPDGPRGPTRAESRPGGDAATVSAGREPQAQAEPVAGLPTALADAAASGAVGTPANAVGNLGHTVAAARADLAPVARAAVGVGQVAGTQGRPVTAATADLAAAASSVPGARDGGAARATLDATPPAEISAQQAQGATHAAPGARGEASIPNALSDVVASFKGAAGAGGEAGAKAVTAVAAVAAAPTTQAAQAPVAGAFSMATPASAAALPAAREATLASGPGHEGFARELGAQVSVFVREGVQQARLQLNPQDMGPVLVQIQLEGQTAQVHMAAELQPTRQALEQALPTLASQLSDAGITLTGGGVSERPDSGFGAEGRAGRDPDTPRGRDGGAGDPGLPRKGAELAPETRRWSRERSLVDLIA